MNVHGWLLAAATVLSPAAAAAQMHPFLALAGRYATAGEQAYGLLWQGEERPPLALEIAPVGDDGAIIRWRVGDAAYAADIAGRIGRFSYRQIAEVDDLDWQCRWLEMTPLGGDSTTLRTRLACRPDRDDQTTAAITLLLDATLGPPGNSRPASIALTLSEFPAGSRYATRRLSAELTRLP